VNFLLDGSSFVGALPASRLIFWMRSFKRRRHHLETALDLLSLQVFDAQLYRGVFPRVVVAESRVKFMRLFGCTSLPVLGQCVGNRKHKKTKNFYHSHFLSPLFSQ
jgi:hypothetical protein